MTSRPFVGKIKLVQVKREARQSCIAKAQLVAPSLFTSPKRAGVALDLTCTELILSGVSSILFHMRTWANLCEQEHTLTI